MSWNTNGYSNIQKTPIFIIRSGAFESGSFGTQASDGNLWSSTTGSDTYAYNLVYNSSYVYPAYGNYRQYGFPVRCIARELK